MQKPLIKDGIVVNIIEIGEHTLCVSKAEHKELEAQEMARYAADLVAWRNECQMHAKSIEEAKAGRFMAIGIVKAAKDAAKDSRIDPKHTLDRILMLDSEVEAWEEKLSRLKALGLPPKPQIQRAKRWILPEGHEVGPEGGQIGDIWDGKTYVKPVLEPRKPKEQSDK